MPARSAPPGDSPRTTRRGYPLLKTDGSIGRDRCRTSAQAHTWQRQRNSIDPEPCKRRALRNLARRVSRRESEGRDIIGHEHVHCAGKDSAASAATYDGSGFGSPSYFDASLAVTAFVRDARSGRPYLVYVNRSDVDLLSGFWGPFARAAIESRVREDGPGILRAITEKLAQHPSTDAAGRPTW